MSRIEDYWDDRIVYNVGFVVANREGYYEEETVEFHKSLVFPAYLEEHEIRKLILSCFDNILRITFLDEVSEALELKTTLGQPRNLSKLQSEL